MKGILVVILLPKKRIEGNGRGRNYDTPQLSAVEASLNAVGMTSYSTGCADPGPRI
jgi:hypothetical protein